MTTAVGCGQKTARVTPGRRAGERMKPAWGLGIKVESLTRIINCMWLTTHWALQGSGPGLSRVTWLR